MELMTCRSDGSPGSPLFATTRPEVIMRSLSFLLLALALIPLTAAAQWSPVSYPQGFDSIQFFLSGDDHLYAAGGESVVYSSDDLGLSWSIIGTGLPQEYAPVVGMGIIDDWFIMSRSFAPYNYRCRRVDGEWGEWTPLDFQGGSLVSITPAGSSLYALAAGDLYGSTDLGETWSPLTDPTAEYLNDLFVAGDYLYVSPNIVNGGDIYRSGDGGHSWEAIATELGSSYICEHIVFEDELYLSLYHGGGDGSMWSSDDFGETWSPVAGLPTDDNINGMALTADGILIGASGSNPDGQSVFFSEDFLSWEDYTGDLPQASQPVNELVSHDGWLFKTGGTVTRYRAPHPMPASSAGHGERTARANKLSAAPNPFGPETQIRYTLSRASQVRVGIYDLAGRHVATLFDGRQPGGSHRIAWSGEDMRGGAAPAGVYLVRIHVDRSAHAYKLFLMQ
ncbi:MAG: T9SS type A sorting domain-containing protein [Candidatus Eisenbacteria bacterium]|nr:T9SS type A sorting domain-containing protein [Candidatus Eisenbacteria bacterium]